MTTPSLHQHDLKDALLRAVEDKALFLWTCAVAGLITLVGLVSILQVLTG